MLIWLEPGGPGARGSSSFNVLGLCLLVVFISLKITLDMKSESCSLQLSLLLLSWSSIGAVINYEEEETSYNLWLCSQAFCSLSLLLPPAEVSKMKSTRGGMERNALCMSGVRSDSDFFLERRSLLCIMLWVHFTMFMTHDPAMCHSPLWSFSLVLRWGKLVRVPRGTQDSFVTSDPSVFSFSK